MSWELILLVFAIFASVAIAQDDTCMCGQVNRLPAPRIVGGRDTDPNEWPWQAHLNIFYPSGANGGCGGTVLSETFALTAAHCKFINEDGDGNRIPYEEAFQVLVSLGDHVLTTAAETRKYVSFGTIKHHPRYVPTGTDYDAAIVKLVNPVKFDRYPKIRPACFPMMTDFPADGDRVAVTGWGALEHEGDTPDTLQEVSVRITNQARCRRDYQENVPRRNRETITARMFCAGRPAGMDSCQGDSGGPAVHFNAAENKYDVHGIVSFGYKCAEANVPGVYARVTNPAIYNFIVRETDSDKPINCNPA